jgi:hypothetical protein
MESSNLKWRTKAMRTSGIENTDGNSGYVAAESNSRAHSNPRSNYVRFLVAVLCALLIAPGDAWVYARPARQDAAAQDQADSKIPNDQLDSLVAPIALYPDPLLAQVLAASTYPLELVQLQQWLAKHPDLKGQALTDAVEKEDWDPSVQAMSAFPDLVKQMFDGIKWTTDLGNAFLAQQSDVMDAVQRMRKKAQDTGNLKSTEQQKVETKVIETKTVVVIEQANPQIVYVPSYNPVVVYGPPVYPYPPIYYPPPSYYAAGVAIAFGVGLAVGSYYRGGWGWGPGWGHSNVNININNNYVKHYNNTNINRNGNRASTLPAGGGNNWQHNAKHRGGTPYSNRATATQYGGTARGDSAATRQANARQNQARQQPATMNRGGGANASTRPAGGGANPSTRPGGGGTNASTRPAGGGASNMGANRGGANGGGGDRVGNRQVPNTPAATNKSAFGGASSGMSGNAARTSNQRGASSMGASRGGGGRSGGRNR